MNTKDVCPAFCAKQQTCSIIIMMLRKCLVRGEGAQCLCVAVPVSLYLQMSLFAGASATICVCMRMYVSLLYLHRASPVTSNAHCACVLMIVLLTHRTHTLHRAPLPVLKMCASDQYYYSRELCQMPAQRPSHM